MPHDATTIRPANKNDAALLLSFIRRLAEYQKLAHEVVACEADLRRTLFGEQPSAEALIAEYTGKPAGFAIFFTNYSTFLAQPGIYLEDLFVLPEFRGQGIGKTLLEFLTVLALERNMGRLDWSVLNWNVPARKFYEQIGARLLTDWTHYRLDGEALQHMAENRVGVKPGQ